MGFALDMPKVWIWAAMSPLILRLARRYPLHGPGWPARLLLHTVLSALFVLVGYLAFEIYYPWFPWPVDQPLMARTLRFFALSAVTDSLLYWVVLAFGHVEQEAARAVARERRATVLEEQLSRARLDALTVRLQPHFLFNTLHAISTLVLESPRNANRMITRLSDMLRLTLSRTRTPFVPLHQELELLEHYIAIQDLRFGDHLSINLTVAGDATSATVPALLLQPIVENAVRHAIGAGNPEARVDIEIRRVGDRLRLEVHDNGPGFKRDMAGLEEGEGLRNTRARLREAYGEHQLFALADRPEGGASVTIELPIEVSGSEARMMNDNGE
jgi:signal transduction histidine kinase